MCPFIENLSGRSFVETIRVEEGRIHNLPYHNVRMNRTRADLFGAGEAIDLVDHIRPEAYRERTKCRVEYAREILRVEYAPYRMRPVRSLRLVVCDTVDYTYKSADRRCLNELFSRRAEYDDILVVRDGLLTDTSICNIALWNGTSWITPAHPLLRGTTRACLLDKGLIREGDIRVEDLRAYDRICLFNALIGFGEVGGRMSLEADGLLF